MYNVNLLNKPGEQTEDVKNNSISFIETQESTESIINKPLEQEKHNDKKNIIIFIIIIVSLGVYIYINYYG